MNGRWQTLLIACTITLIYSTLGGLKAVIITDFVQFVMAMTGSIVAAIYIINLPEIGGLSELLNHEKCDWKDLVTSRLI